MRKREDITVLYHSIADEFSLNSLVQLTLAINVFELSKNATGGCYASKKYLAKKCLTTDRTVRYNINILIEKGCITSHEGKLFPTDEFREAMFRVKDNSKLNQGGKNFIPNEAEIKPHEAEKISHEAEKISARGGKNFHTDNNRDNNKQTTVIDFLTHKEIEIISNLLNRNLNTKDVDSLTQFYRKHGIEKLILGINYTKDQLDRNLNISNLFGYLNKILTTDPRKDFTFEESRELIIDYLLEMKGWNRKIISKRYDSNTLYEMYTKEYNFLNTSCRNHDTNSIYKILRNSIEIEDSIKEKEFIKSNIENLPKLKHDEKKYKEIFEDGPYKYLATPD